MSLLTKKLRQEPPRPGGPPEDPKTIKTVWEYYNERMEIIDREREKEWLEQMDTVLIFAALFAGFISAFLIELLGRLEPDPIDIIQDVLIYQTQMMRNSTLGPYVPPVFSPPEHIVIVNALFYASLGVTLLAAFIAMLIKSWVREFDRGLAAMSLPEQRAKTREFRYLGMERWKLPGMVGILPLLIQISLLLFCIGLVLFLFHISTPSFCVTMAIFGIGILYYATTMSISVFVTSSPFHSPLSRILAGVYRIAHIIISVLVDRILFPYAENLPTMALERFCSSTLHKSCPYPEKAFEKPIADITMDEVQLSTVASALRRLHDSAPDSQHSEALQWSVWQLAGSTALNTPPLFDLPDRILERRGDEEYFSHRPPAMLVAFLAISLRGPTYWEASGMTTVRSLLQRMEISKVPGAQVVVAAFDYRTCHFYDIEDVRRAESNLTNVIRRMEVPIKEMLWLLGTLTEHCVGRGYEKRPFLIEICLVILSKRASGDRSHKMELLEAVVTLAAMSCSLRPKRLRSHITPAIDACSWCYPNVENPAIFTNWLEDTPSDYHKHLISLLFLVVDYVKCLYSTRLAVQYFNVITEKGDLPLYTSALTAIAPVIGNRGLSIISEMLVAPQAQELTHIIHRRLSFIGYDNIPLSQDHLLKKYDIQLGASESPNPHLLAIVFMLSKYASPRAIEVLKAVIPELKNPWLRLAARVAARLDIPDGPGLPMESLYDHRVLNMIAALSLLRYTEGTIAQYTKFHLLESFLESRELSIFSVALEYYMMTTISDPGPPPPYCLSAVVSAVFNFILPDHPLWVGWRILGIFVYGYERLSAEWRRSFVDGFFTLSRRPLLKQRGGTEDMTQGSELNQILTWEYFNEEEQEREWTDLEFSGLDWMAMAWSLHLSEHSGRKGKGKSRDLGGFVVDEEFVLRALCKLLEAAPSYQLTPIAPKLYEFLQWFDGAEFLEYRRAISKRIRDAEEFQKLHCFHKFHCMWYI